MVTPPPIILRRWAVVVVAFLLFFCVSNATQETSDRATTVIVDNGEEEEAEPVVVATEGLVVEEHHDIVGGERIVAHQDDPEPMERTSTGRIIIEEEELLLDNDTSPKGHHHAGKWGTAATGPSNSESSPSLGDDSQFTMDSLAATAGAANNASRIVDGSGKQRRSWGQVDHSTTHPQETTNGSSATTANEEGEPEESKTDTTEAASTPKGGSSSTTTTRHIPNLAKSKYVDSGSDGNDKNAFPEGFRLSARVYTATDDGLAHFDDNDDTPDGDDDSLFLPYVHCGADGSTTAGLRVDRIYVREAIAAPTVWDNNYGGGGDDRADDSSLLSRPPTLAIALRPFGMKLDSGEERHFRPGDVVLLEDTIRPGHQIFASSDDTHRDLVVMFVTLRRPHYDIGREHSSIHKQLATTTSRPRRRHQSSSCDNNNSSNEPSLLQTALEWHERRTRMVIVGIISFSLSTLVAEFLAKTMPLLLAAGIGGLGFVTGATYGLTVLVESIFTKLHVRAVRRRLDQKRQRARRPSGVVDEEEGEEEERHDEH
jgi:hypothetical protein